MGLAPTGKRRLVTAHTPCSRWRLPAERQLCSGSGHSRPQRELTVSATFRSSRRQRDRDADDRSQGSADVARRMCVARWFPERQLNRCRGHWASKTNRMSAAHGAGLTHPTLCCRSCSKEADIRALRCTVKKPPLAIVQKPDRQPTWPIYCRSSSTRSRACTKFHASDQRPEEATAASDGWASMSSAARHASTFGEQAPAPPPSSPSPLRMPQG